VLEVIVVLDLNDPRWNSLSSTYTSGAVVSALLGKLESGTLEASERDQLLQELCHQYDSTEAGYAAVSHLIRASHGRPPGEAFELLSFAAHIVSCGQRETSDLIPDFLADDLTEAQQVGLAATLALLSRQLPSPNDVRYFLAALASFLGRHELYFLLEGADCGIECPNCHDEIFPLETHVNLLRRFT
jgi:hypothetical protein